MATAAKPVKRWAVEFRKGKASQTIEAVSFSLSDLGPFTEFYDGEGLTVASVHNEEILQIRLRPDRPAKASKESE